MKVKVNMSVTEKQKCFLNKISDLDIQKEFNYCDTIVEQCLEIIEAFIYGEENIVFKESEENISITLNLSKNQKRVLDSTCKFFSVTLDQMISKIWQYNDGFEEYFNDKENNGN